MSYTSKFTGKEIDSLLDKVQASNNFIGQVVLKEINEEYATNGADEFVSLNKYYSLDDSIYNYDYLLVNWYCKSSSDAYRMPATPIVVDVGTIRKAGFPYQIRANLNLSNNTETNDISMEFQSETQLRWMQVRGTYAKVGIFNVCGIKCNGSSSGTSNTPIGTIIPYMGLTAPRDYLVCDGSILNVSDYPALASHFETQFGTKNHFGGDGSITFALPDLRNEFLRGYGDISGEVGQHQDATQIANYRSYSDSNNGLFYIPAKQNYNQGGANADERIATTSEVHKFTTTTLQSDSGTLTYYSARPTNVAVLYCIKYTESNNNSGENSTFKKQVLFEGEFAEVRVMSEVNLLNDNVFNYDIIYLTTYQKTNDVKYRIHTSTIDPSTLRVSEATSLWTSSVHYDTHGYYLGGNFGDGTQLYITESIPGTEVEDREHGICKVIGIKY